MRDYIQLISIIGAVALGFYAAYGGKWEVVSAIITGLFAILTVKESKNDKAADSSKPADGGGMLNGNGNNP